MNIEIQKNEKECIVLLVGRLDATTAPKLEKTLGENMDNIETLILDFNGLEYISSAGLRVVLSVQKQMQQIGTMKVIHVGQEVMDIFEMTGFVDILHIE